MKSVSVIGLGVMGSAVAYNFAINGHSVKAYNRTNKDFFKLTKSGVDIKSTIAGAVKDAEIIIEVTADDESSKQMWLGPNGILANGSKDATYIAFATLSARWVDELALKCKSQGLKFLDIPMTGGKVGADSGELTLLAGGDINVLENVKNDLGSVSKEIKYFGKAGNGMRYKLILNALQAVHITALGEAINIAKSVGLDQKIVGEALCERPGGVMTKLAWDGMVNAPKQAGFCVDWIAKDLRYANDLSDKTNHPYLLTAKDVYEDAIKKGNGKQDWTSVNRL